MKKFALIGLGALLLGATLTSCNNGAKATTDGGETGGGKTTVKNADKIFVIDGGKVVDSGTHSELLKNSKAYKKLYAEELESEN